MTDRSANFGTQYGFEDKEFEDYSAFSYEGHSKSQVIYLAREKSTYALVTVRVFLDAGESFYRQWKNLAAFSKSNYRLEIKKVLYRESCLIVITERLKPVTDDIMIISSYDHQKIIKLGCDICQAVGEFHSADILNLDIKPANIYQGDGTYKLGYSAFETDREKDRYAGTLPYIAPELFRKETITPAADIYSLGITLYELLTGRIPFVSPGFGPQEIFRAIERRLGGETIPPVKTMNQVLSDIVLKASSYQKEERFQSASEMEKELETELEILQPIQRHGNPSFGINPNPAYGYHGNNGGYGGYSAYRRDFKSNAKSSNLQKIRTCVIVLLSIIAAALLSWRLYLFFRKHRLLAHYIFLGIIVIIGVIIVSEIILIFLRVRADYRNEKHVFRARTEEEIDQDSRFEAMRQIQNGLFQFSSLSVPESENSSADSMFRLLEEQFRESESEFSYNESLKSAIESACIHLMENRLYTPNLSENTFNDYIRDMLSAGKYTVLDQTRQGESESGKDAGEIDIKILRKQKPAAIIEALKLNSLDEKYLDEHIRKLLVGYDPAGVKRKYLLVYYTGKRYEEFMAKMDNALRCYEFPYQLLDISSSGGSYVTYANLNGITCTMLQNGREVVMEVLVINLRYK